MADQEFKRNTAFKLRIGDVLQGKPIFEADRFRFLELGNKNIVRINIAANIVDKYESTTESKFMSITIDDGSGQIKLKTFGDDTERFKDRVNQGETVIVIGTLRHWNNELYISPEIIKLQDPKYLLLRKLELDKVTKKADPLGRDQIIAVKDKILGAIKNAEVEGGIEKDKLILNLKDISPEIINQEIKKLLEEGIIFEPRPGKVRYLG